MEPNGRPLALPANIRQVTVANTPAYHETATITSVKSSIVHSLGLDSIYILYQSFAVEK